MYHKITNPITNRKVSIHSILGRKIIQYYLNSSLNALQFIGLNIKRQGTKNNLLNKYARGDNTIEPQ